MSHKYDINSDQLKCNFCTQWFKCTLHFANLQRYSLKACYKCLRNFNYTLLHPDTHKIYRVLLLDINIQIPPPPLQTLIQNPTHSLILELELTEQEIKAKIAEYYEQKVRKLMQQMQEATKRVEVEVRTMKETMFQRSRLQESQKSLKIKNEMLRKIQQLKNRPIINWIQSEPILTKNASGLLSSRTKSSYRLDQQNRSSNQPQTGCGKKIKDKISGTSKPLLQSKQKNTIAHSRQSRQQTSRPKSLTRSVLFKSVKCLDQSQEWTPSTLNYQESERAQITRLLEKQRQTDSYLPFEMSRDDALMNKCESTRTQADSILDLKGRTSKGGQIIQLIGAQASRVNFQCFLQALGSQSSAKVVRVIKAGMTDYDFDALLRFLSRHSAVETLIVTNNRLSELSVQALRSFLKRNPSSNLKRVYMGNNRIVRQRAMASWRGAESNVELCF